MYRRYAASPVTVAATQQDSTELVLGVKCCNLRFRLWLVLFLVLNLIPERDLDSRCCGRVPGFGFDTSGAEPSVSASRCGRSLACGQQASMLSLC